MKLIQQRWRWVLKGNKLKKKNHETNGKKRNKRKMPVFSFVSFIFVCFVVFLLPPGLQTQSPKPQRPNILFAIADDWSYGHAGVYGSKFVKTPAFDRVAREGVLFTRAFTPNAKCAPSRAILLTGRNSWQLEEAANHVPFFPAKFKTWVEALAENGYFTGMTAKGWGPGVARSRIDYRTM
jgi:N-sulfoglucosamine sulfohydrolase